MSPRASSLSNTELAAYSVAGLAARWGCSRQHIYGMIRRKELTSFQIGTLIRVAVGEVARVEGCGLNSIGANGRPFGGRTDEQIVARYIPPIEEPLRGG